MKLKYLYPILIAGCMGSACSKEDHLTASTSALPLRYEFPQGDSERDQTAAAIAEKYGVYLIYKNIDTMDFRRSWTNTLNYIYTAQSLNEVQADFQIQFMQNHIFPYVPQALCRKILPPYYYLLADFKRSGSDVMNYTDGLDFWISSIFTAAQPALPTPEQQKEYRVRIFRQILGTAFNRELIVLPDEFNEGFDYQSAISSWSGADNYYVKRGFPGSTPSDGYNLGSLYSLPSPGDNFISYLFLCIRYTEEEFQTDFPAADYPFIGQKRQWVKSYVKEKYGFDLQAIAEGPEL